MTDILFFKPFFSHTIWGGTRLREDFGYDEPGEDLGECWGISGHPSGMCYVKGGEYDGRSLADLWRNEPQLFGRTRTDGDTGKGSPFPLLIKIIDAKSDLSIQVHPDDEYARVHENGSLGKTECWYILDCPEDGKLVVGHNASSREELASMIENGRWSELIREVPVKRGDFIQIDPGTMHAIKGGVMLLETQQSSDITYRVYDYDRLQNGKPRQLHIRQSIDVMTVPAAAPEESVQHFGVATECGLQQLYRCGYYTVYRGVVKESESGVLRIRREHPFLNLSVIDGSGTVEGKPVKKGDHMILTAAKDEYTLGGDMEVILSGI